MIKTEKPVGLKEEHLTYLDILRESGVTNMFGASPYLQKAFNLNRKDAIKVLAYWMAEKINSTQKKGGD